MLGGTVYTFSLILAVFLIGSGIGGSLRAFLGTTGRSSARGGGQPPASGS